MQVVYDAEFDSLTPTKVWCIVCKDVATEKNYVFRFDKPGWEREFRAFAKDVSDWVGVNSLVFDGPNINYLMGGPELINAYRSIDLLIISRLVYYARPGGHSVNAWAQRFGMLKPEVKVYDDPDMIEVYVHRCEEDVEIQYRIYKELLRFIEDPQWAKSIKVEHEMQRVCLEMQENGFSFNQHEAAVLSIKIREEMAMLEDSMTTSIPSVLYQDGEIKLKRKKDGKPTKVTEGYVESGSDFVGGNPLFRFHYEPFNPGSAKQRIELLNRSGWKPKDKTKGHLQCGRDLKSAKRKGQPVASLEKRMEKFRVYGWKVDEASLNTLPPDAPEGARLLATWLSLEGRRSDVEEWCNAYNPHSGRIHGTFTGLGSWPHRMAHSAPNQGNIFGAFHPEQCKDKDNPTPVESVKLRFNGVLRGLWRAEPGKYLVGADAEGIQLRILAHLINDPSYRATIESGSKDDRTDIHNVNMDSLSPHCRSRDDAKTFIYAWVLNAQAALISGVLGCTFTQAKQAMVLFLDANPALKEYKERNIPAIAQRGYFDGIDGRKVIVPSAHKVLAGELQNGESTVMKHATILWRKWAEEDGLRYKAVDLVHDEWQSEVYEKEIGHRLGQLKCDALIKTGQDLGVRCALRGEYKLGRNWYETH